MARNALDSLKVSRFGERFVSWNGYVRKYYKIKGIDQAAQKWWTQVPSAPPPVRPLLTANGSVNWQ